jgi:parallel beta helix pectate lyase-like protein
MPRPAQGRRVRRHLFKETTMRLTNVLRITAAIIVAALLTGTAHAQLFRAYVAPVALGGNDLNDCTLPTPCRLLPAALAAVADGGEIWMLGSANYNVATFNITKSVSILAIPGAVGSVVATATGGGPAISIATPGVNVSLRNLVIAPLAGAGGTDGISMTNGSSLTVEKCQVANVAGSGIFVANAVSVQVTDTTIRDNGVHGLWLTNGASGIVARSLITGNGTNGIYVYSNSAVTTTADIAYSTIGSNSGSGVLAQSGNAAGLVQVSVRDSQIVDNTNSGLIATSGFAAAVILTASNNIVSHNGEGIDGLGAGARVWAAGNTVSNNTFGLVQSGTVVFESASNNAVRNNVTNITGTITPIAPL